MILSPRRLFFGTGTALVGIALLAAIVGSGPTVTTNARHRAEVATRQLDSIAATRDDSTRAIALAYGERARLGMGSPFRLIDQAIHDQRLSDSTRRIVAWAIVGRIFANSAYQIDPAVLDVLGPSAAGVDHLALIERVVGAADDPRTAESVLRVAYGLASANGTLGLTSVNTVADVVAQVRDRALATRDLRRAIGRAANDRADLIDELIHLRATRELDVERPLLAGFSARQRVEAIDGVRDVLAQIEAIHPRYTRADRHALSPLNPRAAIVLARVGSRLPPLSATRVTVNSRAANLRADSTLGRAAVQYLSSATNEETLVAAHAYADHTSRGRSVSTARTMVSAAVALRAHAQDVVWFPGDAGPAAASVVGRLGLKGIAFDSDVPRPWRPFYVRMIASAFDDIALVFPGYEPTNLTVRIGMRSLPDSALAMHDPRTHTLRLTAMTATGALAHEIAHDIDWQAARRLFATTGGYATDRSLKEQRLTLANSVRSLAAARVVGRGRPSPFVSARPAEVFARGVDWLVADALAQMGRSNGYLSAIEDPLIAGFAAIPTDAASLSGAAALVSGLTEMTYLPDSLGKAYVGRWASLERLDPAAVMLRVLDTPMAPRRGMRAPFGFSAETMTELATGSLCRLQALRSGSAHDRLMAMTIEARAKGIVLRRARTLETTRPVWARAMLGEILWNANAADDVLLRTTAAVVEGVGRADMIELPPTPFRPACKSSPAH